MPAKANHKVRPIFLLCSFLPVPDIFEQYWDSLAPVLYCFNFCTHRRLLTGFSPTLSKTHRKGMRDVIIRIIFISNMW